jgi:hypothetical protein
MTLMSLLRLLTAGKSLVGVKEAEGRYRLTSQRLLPTFGSAKNPFGNKATVTLAASDAPTASGPGSASAGDGIEPNTGKKQELRAQGAVRRTVTALLGKWAAKSGGMFARPNRQTARPAVPKLSKRPVQGELSLDRVQVVRNDLSDADLEVVPVKRSAVPAESPQGLRAEGSGEALGCGAATPGRIAAGMR